MNIFNDFHKRFIIELLKDEVEFIIVGGLSVVFHGYIRTTGDMDLWINATNENKQKLIPVIRQFGLLEDSISLLESKDFTNPLAFHFNDPPQKIEFLTHITGIKFKDAYPHCEYLELDGLKVPFLGLEDLITNKLITGRIKDQADVEELQKIHHKKQQ